LSRIPVFFRHNVRLVFADPSPIIQFIFVPLLMMAILKPAQELILQQEGFKNANGAEQVVPGFTVMMSFFWTAYIGRSFFSEYSWGTWERLHATKASAAELMLGKLLPGAVLIAIQNVVLFGLGALIFDLNANGAVWALVFVSIGLNATLLAMSLALVALCRTMAQVDALTTLATMLFATLGGALVPVSQLPSLAEDIAPAVPSYWALKAARDVILEGEGAGAVVVPTLALFGFAALFTVIAIFRFNVSESKQVATT